MHTDDRTLSASGSDMEALGRVRDWICAELTATAARHDKLLLDGRWVERQAFERDLKKARRHSLMTLIDVSIVCLMGLVVGELVLILLTVLLGPW